MRTLVTTKGSSKYFYYFRQVIKYSLALRSKGARARSGDDAPAVLPTGSDDAPLALLVGRDKALGSFTPAKDVMQ